MPSAWWYLLGSVLMLVVGLTGCRAEEAPTPATNRIAARISSKAPQVQPAPDTRAAVPSQGREASEPFYTLHVASLKTMTAALEEKTRLEKLLKQPALIQKTTLEGRLWNRVLLGRFASQEEARAAGALFKQERRIISYRILRFEGEIPGVEAP